MSSIQEALRKAQQEGESKGRDFGFLLESLSSRPLRKKRGSGRHWLVAISVLLLAAGLLLLYGQDKSGPQTREAQKIAKPHRPRPKSGPGLAKVEPPANKGVEPSSSEATLQKQRSRTESPLSERKSISSHVRETPNPTTPTQGETGRRSRGEVPLSPSPRSRTLEEAWRLQKAGDHHGAAALLEEIMRREPEQVQVIVNLANLYLRDLGEPAKALSLYEQALALDPHRASTHVNLGVYYLRMGERVKALEHFGRAIALDSKLAEAHYNLACLHATEGDRSRAEGALNKAVAIDPRCAQWAEEDADLSLLRAPKSAGGKENP